MRTTRAGNVEKGRKTLRFSLKNKKPSYSAHLQTEEHGGVEVEGRSASVSAEGDWQRVSPGGQLAQVPCHFPEWASDREAVWASSGISWDFRKSRCAGLQGLFFLSEGTRTRWVRCCVFLRSRSRAGLRRLLCVRLPAPVPMAPGGAGRGRGQGTSDGSLVNLFK